MQPDFISNNFSKLNIDISLYFLLISTFFLYGYNNVLNNEIVGNAGNNSLNGSTGADTMIGGLGNDTYYTDNASDSVVENENEGIDVVNSSANYTISGNVENLTAS